MKAQKESGSYVGSIQTPRPLYVLHIFKLHAVVALLTWLCIFFVYSLYSLGGSVGVICQIGALLRVVPSQVEHG